MHTCLWGGGKASGLLDKNFPWRRLNCGGAQGHKLCLRWDSQDNATPLETQASRMILLFWLLHSPSRRCYNPQGSLKGTRWCFVFCASKAPQFIDNFCTWLLTSKVRHAHVYHAPSKSDIWSLVDRLSVRLSDFWPSRHRGLSEFLKSLSGASEQLKPQIFFPVLLPLTKCISV